MALLRAYISHLKEEDPTEMEELHTKLNLETILGNRLSSKTIF